ncbi:ferredoxin [Actinokineospora auranticolor]|uniref:Ferredoxin n=1 Tax=Actinokineospora auranticolor TaxID=155976 RepID=A0A2S6H1W9_9PSEU|nr:ferredoxin [Actinokineospora auranticolor]PPK71420.1 ferredoxin [Actinokineospora auranticolor]
MKITLDRDRCISAGRCAYAAPTVFDQDDDGVVVLLDTDPGEDVAHLVEEAQYLCPAMAITTA